MTHAIDRPGVYDIPAEVYHEDPCPEPSLSASIAKVLLNKTARHAWMAHPRLNPDHEEENKLAFDIGHAAHALMLEGEDGVEIIEADSYRTKAAKEARDAAYAAGKTPLLPHQAAEVRTMVVVGQAQLADHAEASGAFENGKPEQTLVWQEHGIWCRARLDWLPANGTVFYDYKTTTDANPDAWQRRAFELGADLQAAFYRRGIRAVLGIDNPQFRFVVQEKTVPYALSVVELTPAALALGDAKVHMAIETWRQCFMSNCWPGYPREVCYLDAPGWHEAQFEAIKARDVPATVGLDWQAPLAPMIEEEVL